MFLEIYKKYKEIINYIIFGIGTTVVNFIIYFLFIEVFDVYYIISNVIAWFFSVLFAYITNRIYVFEKVNHTTSRIAKEIVLFFSSRILSGFVETSLLYILVDLCSVSSKASKIAVAFIVVLLNYIFSKLIVFKKHS